MVSSSRTSNIRQYSESGTVSTTVVSKPQFNCMLLQQTTITAGSSSELTSTSTFRSKNAEQQLLFLLRCSSNLKNDGNSGGASKSQEIASISSDFGLKVEKTMILPDFKVNACDDIAVLDVPQVGSEAYEQVIVFSGVLASSDKNKHVIQLFYPHSSKVKVLLLSKTDVGKDEAFRRFFRYRMLACSSSKSTKHMQGVFLATNSKLLWFSSPVDEEFVNKLSKRSALLDVGVENEIEIVSFSFDNNFNSFFTSSFTSNKSIHQSFLLVLYRTTNTTSPQYFIKILSLSVTVECEGGGVQLTSASVAQVPIFQSIPRTPVEIVFNSALSCILLVFASPANHSTADLTVTTLRIPPEVEEWLVHPKDMSKPPSQINFKGKLQSESKTLGFKSPKDKPFARTPALICDTFFILNTNFQIVYCTVIGSLDIWQVGVRKSANELKATCIPVEYENIATGEASEREKSELKEIKHMGLYQSPSEYEEFLNNKKMVTLSIVRGSNIIHKLQFKYTRTAKQQQWRASSSKCTSSKAYEK